MSELNARLAQAMGYPEEKWPYVCRIEAHPIDESYDDAYCIQCARFVVESPRVPPAFDSDPAASRMLMEWLLSDDSDAKFNEIVFLSALMKNYSYLWQPGKVSFNAGEVRGIIFRALTAPPAIIAAAALAALEAK